jgi:MraZ protein
VITGEYRAALDEKGRVLIPARVRSELDGEELVVTRGIDRCLWLFPSSQWKRIAANLMDSTSLFQARARLIHRRIIAPAQEAEFDKAGRINIPPSLREYAGLSKECIVLGIENYLEIWDEGAYRSYWEENEAEFQAAAEELGKIVSV